MTTSNTAANNAYIATNQIYSQQPGVTTTTYNTQSNGINNAVYEYVGGQYVSGGQATQYGGQGQRQLASDIPVRTETG